MSVRAVPCVLLSPATASHGGRPHDGDLSSSDVPGRRYM